MADAQLVRHETGDHWGVYYPDRNVIEAAIGDEVNEIPGEYLGVVWHAAPEEDLRESIEVDIETVREDIEELRERDLNDEQKRELRRMELRLESHEKVLEIAREVSDKEDNTEDE